ncbi:MAG: nitrate reductase associated protein [Ferruginibacter sp.]|nr:nitrate reductase associated protein [Ferruginibacter sp.]
MKERLEPSEFINLKGIEYFNFEEDFVEENMRCIPMTIRYKMDIVGIKLKLSEWSKFKIEERISLATMSINDIEEKAKYKIYLSNLIEKSANSLPSLIIVEENHLWDNLNEIPTILQTQAHQFNITISQLQWQKLTTLQRFTLLKLCKPGHENKNFPKAIKEFGLVAY